jgi:two-component system, OmpR family, alkaline phosphatase synthesis response regulator PhoP
MLATPRLLMRREETFNPHLERYAIGPLELTPEEMSVLVAGQRVWLTRRELEVLRVLAEHAGRPVSRSTIHRRVWGEARTGNKDRSVEVYIRRLRVKLAATAPEWDHIHTHHNIGYRLDPEPRDGRS